MKIEMLEKVMHGRDVFEAGETRVVDDDLGAYFCGLGWAKDTAGRVPTGERNTQAVTLTPDSVAHKTRAGGV